MHFGAIGFGCQGETVAGTVTDRRGGNGFLREQTGPFGLARRSR
jgi:hypothetical protein